ncbi:C39 family peptidase [Nocardioides pocheonensis]|uniref:Peptidase C39 family protein n=1 Tax=Nocardioides pocheonensis TaxID=661485 RepID=A0A3N0GXZ5_9ACTN|nr:C39 family peptidase [Nocardioides pocheonensis]RNM17345.1 peptidase C39 family protein [Nocardioides pocheonensis]
MTPTPVRRFLTHPRVLVSLIVLVALVVPLGVLAHGRSDGRPRVRMVADAAASTLTRHTAADFAGGRARGTAVANGALTLARPIGSRTVAGVRYDFARWTSGWVAPGQSFTELVPSWAARTPGGSWLQVLVRVRDSQGRVSTFKDLGRWTSGDRFLRRRSSGAQADAVAQVSTDTLRAQAGVQLSTYQLRVQLMRRPGHAGPVVRSVSTVASLLPGTVPATSQPLSSTAVSLPVPGYSQMIHRGQDPQYGGGGEAWCSPTSLSMVLGYYGRLPVVGSWVKAAYADRWVNQVARLTYDYRYQGTGNWPFNTAVGASQLGDAFVTRLADLRMAEPFLRAGIPLIVSIRFGRGQLAGAPISATAGHLVVLSGLTAGGDPVVMDPAAPNDATVRRTYNRAQFERAWLGGSGGMAYVLHDAAHPLPARPAGVRAW